MKKKIDISIVVVTRNDNHGLNLNERTNRFINSCCYMSKKHKVQTELIIVEWNPPKNSPSIIELVSPMIAKHDFIDIRIITVPRSLHKSLDNSKNLQLFQMIGKNVGIRRANGEFILATNIDIIFSDQIFRVFKKGLKQNILYRCYRLDVPQNFAFEKSPIKLLKKCKKSFHTINTRFGTFVIRSNILRRTLSIIPFNLRFRVYVLFFTLFRFFGDFNKALPLISYFSTKKNKSTLHNKFKIFKENLKIHFFNSLFFTNACGDFTLMDKKSWEKTRGYIEWPIYSLHIDSFILYQSFYKKIKINILSSSHIFHIDHSIGSGFSVDGEKILFSNLRKKSIPYIDYDEYKQIVTKIKEDKITLNKKWGFKDFNFKESNI